MLENKNVDYTSVISLGIWEVFLEKLDIKYWIKEIYNYKNNNPYSIKRSNQGGYHSESTLHTNSNFYPLVKELNNIHSSIFNNPNVNISRMWVNVSSYSHYNSIHKHGNQSDVISGVLYLQTPPNCGKIVFRNPLDINSGKFIEPKEKTLILFNEIIPHSVEPNLSNEDRISIAYDCKPFI